MNMRRMKNFDLGVQIVIMAVWAWTYLSQLRGDAIAWALLFPGAVIWTWAVVDSWRRWSQEGEDERVRQLVLTAGYISRQVSFVCLLAFLLLSSRMSLEPFVFPLVMCIALVGSDLAARRWLGLSDEELSPESTPAQKSARRVTMAAAIGFSILVFCGVAYIGVLIRQSFVSDSFGWGTEKPGSPEQAAKAKAAGVVLTERDTAPPPAASGSVRRVYLVPKKPKRGKAQP